MQSLMSRFVGGAVASAVRVHAAPSTIHVRTVSSVKAPVFASFDEPSAPYSTQRRTTKPAGAKHQHSATCGCGPLHGAPPAGATTVEATRSVSTSAATLATSGHSFIGKELTEPSSGAMAQLFENNRRWAAGKVEDDPGYFSSLADGQQPKYLFIGCADSRVAANHILGLGPGELFVHRNIANMVVGGDLSVQSVVEYAVEHLKVEDIIVCGHYGCGGVHAATSQADAGVLNYWLSNIREVHRLHRDELQAIDDPEAHHKRMVELNVGEQCLNLFKLAVVQRHQHTRGAPRVHGLVYNLSDGLLKKVPVDFRGYADAYSEVYSLYDLPNHKSD